MKTVYLSGTIDGNTLNKAKSWRDIAGKYLTIKGFNVLDPLRFRETLLPKEDIIRDADTIINPSYIYHRDRLDIEQCDILLANLSSVGQLATIGTLLEIGMALEKGKTVIVFGLNPKYKDHPFLEDVIQYGNLEDAISTINLVYSS